MKQPDPQTTNNSTVSRTLAADTSGLLLAENSSRDAYAKHVGKATPRVELQKTKKHNWGYLIYVTLMCGVGGGGDGAIIGSGFHEHALGAIVGAIIGFSALEAFGIYCWSKL